jgi:outer membrane beta-barrel protein
MTRLSSLFLLLAIGVAGPAAARPRPLSEQPAVRHKVELRDKRLEVVPTFEASVAAEFKHTLSGGLKIEYHITDTFSIGALGFFGTGVNTGLLDQIVDSLPPSMPTDDDPTPSQSQALEHANTMPIHGGVGITFTPWFGKMGLFGKAFLSYDVYISGGFGFGMTTNDFDDGNPSTGDDDELVVCDSNCMDPDPSRHLNNDPRNDGPHNKGFNPGIQYGGGFHLYFSNFAALDLYLRNYMFSDNPSGFDVNFDRKVTPEDRRFLSHLFVGVGISFFIPPKAKISK